MESEPGGCAALRARCAVKRAAQPGFPAESRVPDEAIAFGYHRSRKMRIA